ncbi:MAG: XdhC family protein [Spirochaetes bacterium]|nr:XdhC family protein [Spirochaetota bacterium]
MNIKLYEEAVRLLENKKDFALATVITRDGSTPRASGAKMIIRDDGSILGTIGGGSLEATVMTKAAAVLKEGKSRIEEFHLNIKDLDSLGMICGGDLEVLVDYIDSSNPEYLEMYRTTLTFYKQKKTSYLVTLIPSEETEYKPKKQFVMLEDGSIPGVKVADADVFASFVSKGVSYKIANYGQNKRAILEAINIPHRVFIFGAGHVGEKLGWILNFVDFPVTILDDRPEYANPQRFPYADVKVVDSFEKPLDMLDIDRYSFIVIVTRGHVHDGTVLACSLKTDAGYIGMIGSRRKRDGIYQRLLSSGCTADDLKRVYAPIGIPIGDETPEEIAVSIAAQLIKVRSEME